MLKLIAIKIDMKQLCHMVKRQALDIRFTVSIDRRKNIPLQVDC